MLIKEIREIDNTEYNILRCEKCHYQIARHTNW
jgi:hypothetical protein